MTKITIPIRALSVNAAYSGRHFNTPAHKQFEQDASHFLRRPSKPIKGECEVAYTFYIKNYKRTDTSNLIKTVEDMLVKCGILKDDSQVVFLSAEKVKSDDERIEIEISEYE